MEVETGEKKSSVSKKGSQDLDGAIRRLNRRIEEVDEGIMDEDTLVDDVDDIALKDELIEGHFKKPSDIENSISWKKEETVPIHELVIRNPKDRGLKKRK